MELDLAIVGGGAAGLTAGMYAARARLSATLFDRQGPGGQLINIARVENFPGFPKGVAGFELGPLLSEQALEAGLGIEFGEVTSLRRDGGDWLLETHLGDVRAGAVIVATGSSLAPLGAPGEERLVGRGVSYCATCDGEFFRGRDVAVVGGGDSALDEALHLSEIAGSVTVIHRRAEFRGARITQERLLAKSNVRVLWSHTVSELEGDDALEAIVVERAPDGARQRLEVEGLFVYVGLAPHTQLLAGLVALDGGGHVPVDIEMATELPGLYAAGDIRQRSARQLVSAAGDGATAAIAVEQYLRSRAQQRASAQVT